jgi:hypothetical protein
MTSFRLAVATCLALNLLACVEAPEAGDPGDTQAATSDLKLPGGIEINGRTVSIQVAVDVARPRLEVYDFAVAAENQAVMLEETAHLPGVVECTMLDGAGVVNGARRRCLLTDDTVVIEELIEIDRPRHYGYFWATPAAPPLDVILEHAEASWSFDATARGTRVTWRYDLELTSPLAIPAALVLAPFFRSWMKAGLERLADELPAR